MTERLIVISEADLSHIFGELKAIRNRLDSVEMAPPKDLLSLREMAELLDCSTATVRRRVEDGKIEAVEVAGKVMYRRPA